MAVCALSTTDLCGAKPRSKNRETAETPHAQRETGRRRTVTKWIERGKKIETRERRAYNEIGGLRKGEKWVKKYESTQKNM